MYLRKDKQILQKALALQLLWVICASTWIQLGIISAITWGSLSNFLGQSQQLLGVVSAMTWGSFSNFWGQSQLFLWVFLTIPGDSVNNSRGIVSAIPGGNLSNYFGNLSNFLGQSQHLMEECYSSYFGQSQALSNFSGQAQQLLKLVSATSCGSRSNYLEESMQPLKLVLETTGKSVTHTSSRLSTFLWQAPHLLEVDSGVRTYLSQHILEVGSNLPGEDSAPTWGRLSTYLKWTQHLLKADSALT